MMVDTINQQEVVDQLKYMMQPCPPHAVRDTILAIERFSDMAWDPEAFSKAAKTHLVRTETGALSSPMAEPCVAIISVLLRYAELTGQ
jgi:hypothetical protein